MMKGQSQNSNSSSELLDVCLAMMESHDLTSPAFMEFFDRVRPVLLQDPSVAVNLVGLIGMQEEDTQTVSLLMSRLLDEARMDQENDGAYGAEFLEMVEIGAGAALSAGLFEPHHLSELAGLYRRAGLPVPGDLMIDPDQMVMPEGAEDMDPAKALEDLVGQLQETGAGPFELFTMVDEMTANMPDEMKAAFANRLVVQPGEVVERCGLYFLLSGSPLVQQAAAAGLAERLQASGLAAGTVAVLPAIRAFLPPSEIRALVDDLIKEARRNAQDSQGASRDQGEILEIFASAADGVGAQSLSIKVRQKRKIRLAMIMTKTGQGVKDAFVISDISTKEADELMVTMRRETNGSSIEPATLTMLLEAALADGVEQGRLPAPGILDVMELTGLLDLRPQARSAEALLQFIDPDQRISGATLQKRARWSKSEAGLEGLAPFGASWFEDSTELRDLIEKTASAKPLENELWKILEGRRDIWARRFLQTAAMLGFTDHYQEWHCLAASALALMEDRPLKKIPIMEEIMYQTIEAANAQSDYGELFSMELD